MTASYFVSSAPPMDEEPDDCEESTFFPDGSEVWHHCSQEDCHIFKECTYVPCRAETPQEALATDAAINAKILERLGNRGPEYDEPGEKR